MLQGSVDGWIWHNSEGDFRKLLSQRYLVNCIKNSSVKFLENNRTSNYNCFKKTSSLSILSILDNRIHGTWCPILFPKLVHLLLSFTQSQDGGCSYLGRCAGIRLPVNFTVPGHPHCVKPRNHHGEKPWKVTISQN